MTFQYLSEKGQKTCVVEKPKTGQAAKIWLGQFIPNFGCLGQNLAGPIMAAGPVLAGPILLDRYYLHIRSL